ncbi:thioesterase family protein [Caulobacter segnis]|uniref:thioesterase family protein n=1 Tax=Caulobacter segnis TaxID=88688 RepID=UPI00241005B0|nr:thioesterase family protein [Caulobacter segnis]MDG2520780.1 thioesterase family protein [Caulobacter segnis]
MTDAAVALTPYSSLVEGVRSSGRADIPGDWLQGRTTYGGLSAALCVEAAQHELESLPPLRSAMFTFVGPAGGEASFTTDILRRGKSVTVVNVDMHSQGGLATRATLCFGAARASKLDVTSIAKPTVSAPTDSVTLPSRAGPGFSQHFDRRIAGGSTPLAGGGDPELLWWIRHRDERAGAKAASLLALGDVLPPAAAVLYSDWAPISSMTWMVEFPEVEATPQDGFWLCQSRAEVTAAGYSAQAMTLWGEGDRPILIGRQTVAVFG